MSDSRFTRCRSVAPACAHAPPHAKSTFMSKDGMAGQLAHRYGHENEPSQLEPQIGVSDPATSSYQIAATIGNPA
jgi:hypothetical protein